MNSSAQPASAGRVLLINLNHYDQPYPVYPLGLAYVSHVASAGTTYDPLSGVWTIGALANGASRTLTINATFSSSASEARIVS